MNLIRPSSDLRIRQTSVAEIRALIDAGLMDHKDPFELIDGVLVEMPSEGFEHGDLKNVIAQWLYTTLDLTKHRIFVDTTLYLDEHNAPEPDLYVFPAGTHMRDLKPSDVSLVIEIGNSSLRKDKEIKAPLYAQFGIHEYWLIDLAAGETTVHQTPQGDAYTATRTVAFEADIETEACGGVCLNIGTVPRPE